MFLRSRGQGWASRSGTPAGKTAAYTLALLGSRAHGPQHGTQGAFAKGSRLATIGGAPPDLANLPPGCSFAERCRFAANACVRSEPGPVTLAPGHIARCLRTEATLAAPS